MGGLKGDKELDLSDIGNMGLNKVLELATVRPL